MAFKATESKLEEYQLHSGLDLLPCFAFEIIYSQLYLKYT